MRPGALLRIGDVLVRRTATAHRPCRVFRDRAGEIAFQVAQAGWRGTLFEAVMTGKIRLGDPVELGPGEERA